MNNAVNKENKKKMYLIFHGRFPSEKAASIFAAESCPAFVKQGTDVTLLVPRRFGRGKDDPYEYYNVDKTFTVKYLPTIDFFSVPFFKKFAFNISFITFSFSCFFHLLFQPKDSVIYSNEHLPLLFVSLIRKKTFYEMHDFPETNFSFYKMFYRRMWKILAHNRWKKEKLIKDFGLKSEKIIYEPNAVDLDMFTIPLSKEEARRKLNAPLDKKLVVYTGHLYGWKGTDTLAEAARSLPENIHVIFVGGTPDDVVRFRETYGNVSTISIMGHRQHEEIPLWQKAADVLVLPNTAKEKISKYYTSPMKLFEYMASGRPIVASRLPSVVEIVNEETALLAEPDNPKSFHENILQALRDEEAGNSMAKKAFRDVSMHTWDERARRISDFIHNER